MSTGPLGGKQVTGCAVGPVNTPVVFTGIVKIPVVAIFGTGRGRFNEVDRLEIPWLSEVGPLDSFALFGGK